MDCRTAESLLHGYFDDELDLAASIEIERHVESCRACAARLARERSLRARISASSLHFAGPGDLPGKIATNLGLPGNATRPARRAPPRQALWVASCAVALLTLASIALIERPPSAESLLAQQIRDGHVRSLMVRHLADVASSDQHTVKPWFAGKLDFSPWVEDLSQEGFSLVGGRLDHLDNHQAAALVFKRREHFINLFQWPSDGDRSEALRRRRENGYQIVHWRESGMTFWAVSDLNAEELREFADLVRSRIASSRLSQSR
jgi:anti-sigma factor RsiW